VHSLGLACWDNQGQRLYYDKLEVPEGAEINGELVRIDDSQTPQLLYQDEGKEQTSDGE